MFRNLSGYLSNLPILLMRIPVMLLALTAHEAAHGWAAYQLGDSTARDYGRITLDPLKHLDPIGTLTMLLFGFGWAKPVPVNARNFKNPRLGMALTALAGPATNFLLAFVGVFLYSLAAKFLYQPYLAGSTAAYVVLLFLTVFYMLNLSFAIFNFLPVPPLDGSRILYVLLPPKAYFGVMKYERWIMLGILLLLFLGILDGPLSWLVNSIAGLMFRIVGLLPFL